MSFDGHSEPSPPAEAVLNTEVSNPDATLKEKHQKRLQRGLKWILSGAATLVFSFMLNFLLFHTGIDFSMPMYALTTIGALVCLKGMTDIF